MKSPLRIEKLHRSHLVEEFDCGQADLNQFLIRFALTNQQAEASQTYLALAGEEVVGFYTLVAGQVGYEAAAERLKKGLARHPIPVIVLARLAIATHWHGKGLGSGLLKDAMLRVIGAAEIVGVRALLVHAKDEAAKQFYERFGFVQSPSDPLHLIRLIKEIRKEVR